MRDFFRIVAPHISQPSRRDIAFAIIPACGMTCLWFGFTYLPWMSSMAARAQLTGIVALISTARLAWLVLARHLASK